MKILSVEQAKMIDKYSIEKIGIPSIVLMETAGLKIYQKLPKSYNKYIIICGIGNNGGDGLVIARHLINNKKEVKVIIVGDFEKATKEFCINHNILIKMDGEIRYIKNEIDINKNLSIIEASEVIIDCLFGVGLNRNIENIYFDVIKIINDLSKYVIAIDVPSGLNANTGEVFGICVKADETFSIQTPKKGFYEYKSFEYVGGVSIIDIGIPEKVINQFSDDIQQLESQEYKNMIPRRNKYGHKGNYGKVLVWAGSEGFTGSAYITTQSIVKSGAGLVTLIVDEYTKGIMSNKLTEAMTVNIDDKERIDNLLNQVDVLVCGPGIGTSEKSKEVLLYLIKNCKCKLVLDADAINILSQNEEMTKYIDGRAILTPHHGEIARLIKKDISYVNNNRFNVCKEVANKYNIIVLLKGYYSLITNGNKIIVNPTGNSKMASGGMGDCLTGIISGILAQKKDLFESAILGCYLHGAIGDDLAKSQFSIVATDIVKNIPNVMNKIN